MNQEYNVNNRNQTSVRKVLTVCSAGLLRSPTAAKFIGETYGFNCRAAGMVADYALIPVSRALVHWAEEIVFVDDRSFREFEFEFGFCENDWRTKCIQVLDIPDIFQWNDPVLVECIKDQYDPELKAVLLGE